MKRPRAKKTLTLLIVSAILLSAFVGLGPLRSDLFKFNSAAEGSTAVDPNYKWLLATDARYAGLGYTAVNIGEAAYPYLINTPGELASLSQVVSTLASGSTMTTSDGVTINEKNYVVKQATTPAAPLERPAEPLAPEGTPPPTAPTEPVTPPPEPVIPPAEPVTPPVEPVTPPVEPVTPPVEPVTPPVEPVTPPTEPVTPPTEPVTPPAEPVTPPTEPVTPPAEPVTPPTEPVTPPVEPVTPPVEPVTPPVGLVSPITPGGGTRPGTAVPPPGVTPMKPVHAPIEPIKPLSLSAVPTAVVTPPAAEPAPEVIPPVTEPLPEVTPPATEPLPEVTPPATEPLPEVTPPATEPVPEVTPPATEPAPEGTPPATEPAPEGTPPATEPAPEVTPLPTEPAPRAVSDPATTVVLPAGFEGKYIKLNQSINLKDFNGSAATSGGGKLVWTPIGTGRPFLGIFDGNNSAVPACAIIDFRYSNDNGYGTFASYGLFGEVGNGASVKNITLTTTDFAVKLVGNATSSKAPMAGLIAANNAGTIENCNTQALITAGATGGKGITLPEALDNVNIKTGSNGFGGIAGYNSGTIKGCTFSGNITAMENANVTDSGRGIGGIAGASSGGSITNCLSLGSITQKNPAGAATQYMGGIAGRATGATISQCGAGVSLDILNGSVINNVITIGGGIGGIIGASSGGSITDCFSTGVIKATQSLGGIAGNINGTTVGNSFSSAAIDLTNGKFTRNDLYAGGIVGNFAAGALTNTHFSGSTLRPQIGSVSGGTGGSFSGVSYDSAVSPNSAVATVISGVTTPATGIAANGGYPSYSWMTTASENMKQLHALASFGFINLTVDNAFASVDSAIANLFQIKDPATGMPAVFNPYTVGGATYSLSLAAEDTYGTKIGGVYRGAVNVGGVAVPIAKKLLYAINQTPNATAGAMGNTATTITTGAEFLRMVDTVNNGGGGYIGGIYHIASGEMNAGGATIAYATSNSDPMMSALLGAEMETSRATGFIVGNKNGAKATGIFNSIYRAKIADFSLSKNNNSGTNRIQTGNFDINAGLLCRNISRTEMRNITVDRFSHSPMNFTGSTEVRFGTFFAENLDADCTLDGLHVNNASITITGDVVSNYKDSYIGGIGGFTKPNNTSINNSSFSGELNVGFISSQTGYNFARVGGIFGGSNDGTINITNCRADGTVSGITAGGIIGGMKQGKVSGCSFSGTVKTGANYSSASSSSIGSDGVGGILGIASHAWGNITIENCSVLANIEAKHYAGGIIGLGGGKVSLKNCYATAIITGSEASGAIGGIAGTVENAKDDLAIDIQGCYFAGQLKASGKSGGMIGYTLKNPAAMNLKNSYYDKQLLGGVNSVGSHPTLQAPTFGAALAKDITVASLGATAVTTNAGYAADEAGYYPYLKNVGYDAMAKLTAKRVFTLAGDGAFLEELNAVAAPCVSASNGTFAGFTIGAGEAPDLLTSSAGTDIKNYSAKAPRTQNFDALPITYGAVTTAKSVKADLTLTYNVAVKPFAYGDGSEQWPYLIYDEPTLGIFRDFVNSGLDKPTYNYIIGDAADYSGPWLAHKGGDTTAVLGAIKPVTISMTTGNWAGINEFSGKLNGNASTISGLKTMGTEKADKLSYNAGLFTTLVAGSSVKNLTLSNAEIIVSAARQGAIETNCGILAGRAFDAQISSVFTSGTITTNYRTANAGGLVGRYYATKPNTIDLVTSDCDIKVSDQTVKDLDGGGIIGVVVGESGTLNINRAAGYGKINGALQSGGIIGSIKAGSAVNITNSFSLSEMKSTLDSARIGGLVGDVDNNRAQKLAIKTSYFAGKISTREIQPENSVDPATLYNTIKLNPRAGGLVGAVFSNEALGTGIARYNIEIGTDCRYNYDANPYPAYSELREDIGTSPNPWKATPKEISTAKSNTFRMSQPMGSTFSDMTGADWQNTNVWTIESGLFPKLAKTTPSVIRHVAVFYTTGGGYSNSFTNMYVMYSGARLSFAPAVPAGAPMVLSKNQRMIIATDVAEAEYDIVLTLGSETRSLRFKPSNLAAGIVDFSWFYADGRISETIDGVAADRFVLYNGDALQGLGYIVNRQNKYTVDTAGYITDSNGIPLKLTELDAYNFKNEQFAIGTDFGLASWENWVSIGTEAHPFISTLDGRAKVISGMTQRAGNGYLGLVGVTDGGVIKNIALASGRMPSTPGIESVPYWGNVTDGISINANATAVGTIAGWAKGGAIIENCISSIPIESTDAATITGTAMGGIVGKAENTHISGCAFTGYIYGEAEAAVGSPKQNAVAGGICGTATAETQIYDSYAAGLVDATVAGGICGSTAGVPTVTGCYFSANATGLQIAVGNGADGLVVPTELPTAWNGWVIEAGLYPYKGLFSRLMATGAKVEYQNTFKAGIVSVKMVPHAGAAVNGSIAFTDAKLYQRHMKDPTKLPPAPPVYLINKDFAGEVTIPADGKSFVKTKDGYSEMEIHVGAYYRRILVNVRCWYDSAINGVYHITSAEELLELGEIVNGVIGHGSAHQTKHSHDIGVDSFKGKAIMLDNDIDLSTIASWTPIGSTAQKPFSGTFDGQGHLIYNLNQSGSGGLFGYIKDVTTLIEPLPLVKNVGIGAGKLTNITSGGGLAQYVGAGATVLNCYSGASMQGASNGRMGGLVYENNGTISGCFSISELKDGSVVGGIAAVNNGAIANSYFAGYIKTKTAVVAGIAAEGSGTVSDCYTAGYLSGATVHSSAPRGATGCFIDSRLTSMLDASATATTPGGFSLPAGAWVAGTKDSYPRLLVFTAAGFKGESLLRAERMSSMITTFSGSTSASYNQFSATLTAEIDKNPLYTLLSSAPTVLSVSGAKSTVSLDNVGDAVLYIQSKIGAQVIGKPTFLVVPASIAVAYKYDFSDIIRAANKLNADYHSGQSSSINTWSTPAEGGTAKISTLADLESFIAYVNGGNATVKRTFKLDYNINCGGKTIATITKDFGGIFDGGCYTISNFRLSGSSAALFNTVTETGVVKMLAIDKATVLCTGNGDMRVAVVAQSNRGKIHNVAITDTKIAVTQSMAAAHTLVGSIAAENRGTITACYYQDFTSTGTIETVSISINVPQFGTDTLLAGGIAGMNGGSINGCFVLMDHACYVSGSVTGNYKYIRMIAGINDGGTVIYSYCATPSGNVEASVLLYGDKSGGVSASAYLVTAANRAYAAEWLSCDTYGGSYYLTENRLKLDCFELVKYDLTGYLGQNFMFNMRYGVNNTAGFVNGVCTEKGYLFPNIANMTNVTDIKVAMMLIKGNISYTVTGRAQQKNTFLVDSQVVDVQSLGSEGYKLSGFGNPNRVIVTIKLSTQTEKTPWGVFRKDSSYIVQ